MEIKLSFTDSENCLYSFVFYDESAHVMMHVADNEDGEYKTYGFFLGFEYFDDDANWHWFPKEARDFARAAYKNLAFV